MKLKPHEVQAIRRRADAGETHASLAIEYGVSISTVGRVARRESRRYLEDDDEVDTVGAALHEDPLREKIREMKEQCSQTPKVG